MNLLIVNIDSLRQDKVGCYSDSSLTPNTDKVAEKALIFTQTITPTVSSTPSFSSIVTGCYPVTHGVRGTGWKLNYEGPTIAEILKAEGYKTMAAVGTIALGKQYGLDRGFDDFYSDDKIFHTFLKKMKFKKYSILGLMKKERTWDITNKNVLKWLDKNHNKKFFMFVHYFDIHIDTIGKKEGKIDVIKNYDENIKLVDNAFDQIINRLKKYNLYDKTIIIILSDHGENLESPEESHGFSVKDYAIKVPLIIRNPKFKHKLINGLSRLIDITPTILSFLDIKTNAKFDGTDLNQLIKNDQEVVDEVYCESYPVYREEKCIRTKNWKYILVNNKNSELYKIDEDKEEKNNLAGKNDKIEAELKLKLKKHFSIEIGEREKDEYTDQMLQKLGYLKNNNK